MLKENGNTPAIFDVNTITAFRMNVSATDESDLVKNQKVTKSMTKSKNKSIEERMGLISKSNQQQKYHNILVSNIVVISKNDI